MRTTNDDNNLGDLKECLQRHDTSYNGSKLGDYIEYLDMQTTYDGGKLQDLKDRLHRNADHL